MKYKKNIIFILLLFIAISTKAQFVATYNGFRTSDNKEYLVLHYKDMSAHKLYSLSGKWINRTQYNPNIYAKDIADESIYVHMLDTLKLPGLIKTYVFIDYGINLEFKDEKVRFQPIIHSIKAPTNIYFGYEGKKNNLANVVLFKPDGSCRGKNGRAFSKVLNEWLNKLTTRYNEFMNSRGGEDDW